MGGTTRVPDKDTDFDLYIKSSTDHLLLGSAPVNWERLLLTNPEMEAWTDYRDQWNALYALWGNPSTRTTTVTQDKNALKITFRTFTESLLNRMSGAPLINNTDRGVLHIPLPDRTPTERGAINDTPVISLTSEPGGRIAIKCRVNEDATRASMHPLADAIEAKIKIGNPAPATPADCPIQIESAQATFKFEAGAENAGQRIYVYCRYKNISNPANSGNFGTAVNVIIEG